MIYLSLFWHFLLISLLAFGGGQAALPLVERTAVVEEHWISPAAFSTAVAFGYITPGPVLITATFVGYVTAGVPGALVATLGVFLCPWLLATFAAQQVQRLTHSSWLKAFGKGATPAVLGLLGVTVITLGQHALTNVWYALLAGGAAALALSTKAHPLALLLGGAIVGIIIGQYVR